MPLTTECAGCGLTVEPLPAVVHEWFMSKYGRVDRVLDACPECRHIAGERLSGPGARAYVDSRTLVIGDDGIGRMLVPE